VVAKAREAVEFAASRLRGDARVTN
jgi:hypothetical protein